MLQIWDAIEADFLRDYRIPLTEQVDTMSWRLFLTLLHNLSPYGAVATRVRAQLDRPDDPIDDERAANRFFSSIVSM